MFETGYLTNLYKTFNNSTGSAHTDDKNTNCDGEVIEFDNLIEDEAETSVADSDSY